QIGRAVRTKRWKYSVRAPRKHNRDNGDAAEVYAEDFLYDVEADPHERNNLVRDPAFAGIRDEMKARLLKRMAQAHENIPEIIPAHEA
ncbi:MAG: arylsulfatase, partial [Candidatus Hydrogenedentes bacterium]|nr:arylsulfatase [Candidatus Hydrogenedentota bacterium]